MLENREEIKHHNVFDENGLILKQDKKTHNESKPIRIKDIDETSLVFGTSVTPSDSEDCERMSKEIEIQFRKQNTERKKTLGIQEKESNRRRFRTLNTFKEPERRNLHKKIRCIFWIYCTT